MSTVLSRKCKAACSIALLCAAWLQTAVGGDLGPGEPGWDAPLSLPSFATVLPQQIAVALQKGGDNDAQLQQQGSAQLAVVLQWGQGNQADIAQDGFAQSAVVKQIGTGNHIDIIQQGQFQAVRVLQSGDYQNARIVQKH